METMAVEPVFIDTNILIFARFSQCANHGKALARLRGLIGSGHALVTSRQVLREYLSATTRPGLFKQPLPIAGLLADVRLFERQFRIIEDGSEATFNLLDLLASISCAGKQVHDCNIAATMRAHGIGKLLTHNVADFKRFGGLIEVLPRIP